MEAWDSGVESLAKSNANQILWEGEDEEDDVMDSWDQEPEETTEKVVEKPPPKKVKKKIGERFDEKKALEEEEEVIRKLSPEEELAEKLRRQRLQEESDLSLAKEIFGDIPGSTTAVGSLDSQDDYNKFKEEILKIVSSADKNPNFVNFVEELIQGLCVHLSSADIKKVHTWIGNLHIEKTKLEKGDKGKKSKAKAKAKLKFDDDHTLTKFGADYTEDYEDFI